jgi:hypothetical protein
MSLEDTLKFDMELRGKAHEQLLHDTARQFAEAYAIEDEEQIKRLGDLWIVLSLTWFDPPWDSSDFYGRHEKDLVNRATANFKEGVYSYHELIAGAATAAAGGQQP